MSRVPKLPDANLRWRKELLERAEQDTGFRDEMYTAASQSLLFFINAFAWTLRVFKMMPDGSRIQCPATEAHVPFVTWEILRSAPNP